MFLTAIFKLSKSDVIGVLKSKLLHRSNIAFINKLTLDIFF